MKIKMYTWMYECMYECMYRIAQNFDGGNFDRY